MSNKSPKNRFEVMRAISASPPQANGGGTQSRHDSTSSMKGGHHQRNSSLSKPNSGDPLFVMAGRANPPIDGLIAVPSRQGTPSLEPRASSVDPLGLTFLAEARRFLKQKSPQPKKWDLVREALLGPAGPQLRAQLSLSGISNLDDDSPNHINYGATEDVETGSMLPGNGHERRRSRGSNFYERARIKRKTLYSRLPFFMKVTVNTLFSSYLNILLFLLPFGAVSSYQDWGPGPTFMLNFLGLIPLAAMLGDFTEEVAEHMGDTIGGLINASFGNLVEMVIGVQALWHHEIRVVQASMLGSVLSNLLLVTGSCFFIGGLIHHEQQFNSVAGVANLSLLFLATFALVIPCPLGDSYNLRDSDILLISRVAACFLLAMYLQLILFQLVTHRHLFEGSDDEDEDEEEGEKDEDEVKLGLFGALVGLMVVAFLVAGFSELLVTSIDAFSSSYNVSKTFVGVILLPLVGNATEHMTAVTVAAKNRMELAMGIAVGSATQVALFVVPFLVIAGWIMGEPMSLDFPPIEVIIFVMSVIITMPVLLNAQSNWLLGSLLISCYCFCAFAFWFESAAQPEGPATSISTTPST